MKKYFRPLHPWFSPAGFRGALIHQMGLHMLYTRQPATAEKATRGLQYRPL
jgi:hypothetical protein